MRYYLAVASLASMLVGLSFSLFAYRFPFSSLNPFQSLGSLLFWGGALVFVMEFMMGKTLRLALQFAKTWRGALVGAAYIVVHLLLYGFVLEAILVSVFGQYPFIGSGSAFVSSDLIYPATLENTLLGIALSPSLSLLVPPLFEASLSAFSFFFAIIIDVLVLANISSVRRIGAALSPKVVARAYIVMPATGIVLGASCCMSVPALLSIVSPALAFINNLLWVFYLTYFVFPVLGAVVLKLNFDLSNRTAEAAARMGASPPA